MHIIKSPTPSHCSPARRVRISYFARMGGGSKLTAEIRETLVSVADEWAVIGSDPNMVVLSGSYWSEKAWRMVLAPIMDLHERHPDDFQVLDIGSGLGVIPIVLRHQGVHVVACDHPEQMDLAKIYLERGIPYTTLDLVEGSLPYKDRSFDVVVLKDVIEHLPFSPRQVLGEIRRILRPQATLLVMTPNFSRLSVRLRTLIGRTAHPPITQFFESGARFEGHHREFTKKDLMWMLNEAGFSVAETSTFQFENVLTSWRSQGLRGWDRAWSAVWAPIARLSPSLAQCHLIVAVAPGRLSNAVKT